MSERWEGLRVPKRYHTIGTPQQRYKGTTILRYCNTWGILATICGLLCALSRLGLCAYRARA